MHAPRRAHRAAARTQIESLFAEGEAFKPSGGTKGGEAPETDEKLRARLQELALKAFLACGGTPTSYGRVDIRERTRGAQDLFVLETNPMCSLTANSYFDLSLIHNGWTLTGWLASLLDADKTD